MMLHRHPFVKTLSQTLRHRCGVRPGERLLVAVSGGADSVALLRGLAALAPRHEWSLSLQAAHVNHGLRGEADDEARFVEILADELGLPCTLRDIRPADADDNLENAARRLRYAALGDMAESCDADAIATAHHADDQLETLLMRLIRGSSLRGMGGIAPRRRLRHVAAPVIRPMIELDHARAVAFLRELDQPWREDATNRDRQRWRARLRADVLPVLKALRPDAALQADRFAQRARQGHALLQRAARRAAARLVSLTPQGPSMDRAGARALPETVLLGVLHRVCRELDVGADALGRNALEPIAGAVRDDSGETRRFDLAGGVRVEVGADTVQWRKTSG